MNTAVAPKKSSWHGECHVVFSAAFDRVTMEIPFKREWSNGTGLYDYAVYGEHAPSIPLGSILKSTTPGGRRLFLIGTRLGNVVIFERNAATRSTPPTYCYQSTSNFTQGGWFSDMVLDEYEMEIAVGTTTEPHIGRRIEILYSAMKKTAA